MQPRGPTSWPLRCAVLSVLLPRLAGPFSRPAAAASGALLQRSGPPVDIPPEQNVCPRFLSTYATSRASTTTYQVDMLRGQTFCCPPVDTETGQTFCFVRTPRMLYCNRFHEIPPFFVRTNILLPHTAPKEPLTRRRSRRKYIVHTMHGQMKYAVRCATPASVADARWLGARGPVPPSRARSAPPCHGI